MVMEKFVGVVEGDWKTLMIEGKMRDRKINLLMTQKA